MATLYDYAIPVLLLVFLIICFLAFLWVKQGYNSIQPPLDHKPIFLNRLKPPSKQTEGFQSSPGSGSARSAAQVDLPLELQAIYGEWEITPQDSYYDDYENNELSAIAIQASKYKNITPPIPSPLIFGSSLGAFDAGAITIPWDKDNELLLQENVVWGQVSPEASKSIFLKTYLNEVANNMANLPICNPDDPVNYCYAAPMLQVETRNADVARGLQTSEALIQATGSLPMSLSSINMDLSNLREVAVERYNMFASKLGIPGIPIEPIETNTTQMGAAFENATGRVGQEAHLAQQPEIEANMRNVTKTAMNAVKDTQGKIGIASAALTLSSWLLAVGTGGAFAGIAATLTSVAIALDIFFGVFGAVCMAVEGAITPIFEAMYKVGGVCPGGYKPITELVSPGMLTFLQNFIPLGSFLVTFNPYVCWGKDAAGIANVRLREPPRMPAFMSDRSLSLIYHAAWQSGSSPNIPIAASVNIELDPLPKGYAWLSDSDLANSSNTNEVTAYAKNMADKAKTATSYTSGGSGSGSSKLSSYIAVKLCTSDTTPSPDGKQCLQKKVERTQTIPNKNQCASGKFDDGYNCWDGQYNTACTNQFEYETATTWDDKTGYFRVKAVTCDTGTTTANITTNFKDRLYCASGYELQGLLCYKKCDTGYTADGAWCKGRAASYDRDYMYGTHTMYVAQPFDVVLLKDLSDVKVPYCDFSSEIMLNKMAQFYYSNSLLHPQLNEDGTVQIQMITMFTGVVASSELSCDVACRIEFINYDPITGGKYTVKVGCSYGDDDPEFQKVSFCYRRFYFTRLGTEPQGEFTVTGCTFADYTAPDGKTLSYSSSTNLLVSLSPPDPVTRKTKKFDVINKENVTIIDWDRYHKEMNDGTVAALAMIGTFEAGISIAASIYGAKAGMKGMSLYGANRAANSAAVTLEGTVLTRVITSGAARIEGNVGEAVAAAVTASAATAERAAVTAVTAATVAERAAVKGLTQSEALTLSKTVTTSIQTATTNAGRAVAAGELEATAVDGAIRAAAKEKAIAEGLSEDAADQLVARLMKDMKWPIAETIGGMVGGIVGGIGVGLALSMSGGLDSVMRRTVQGAVPPTLIDSRSGTYVVGSSTTNLKVMTNQNWWQVNQGPVYEIAQGFIPTVAPCQITSKGDKVQVSSAYCRNKYIIRNMVNMYHNTYQNAHIKEITDIEPRGTTGCYYKWNEVAYTPETNTEGTVLIEKEMILNNEMKDVMTCTYMPKGFTDDIKNTAYYVRQYTDSGSSRVVYPTRSYMYTSDIYARYVRVRGAAAATQNITLAQIAVFDASGFNVSTGMTVMATSTGIDGGIDAKDVVNGASTTGDIASSVWQSSTADATEYWQLDLGKSVNIAEVIYIGGSFPEAKGRNIGVRIEFLYTDSPTETPIKTYILPTDESTQKVHLYSSLFTTPMYPLAGPIKIPRPIQRDAMLGVERGCINKCQDRSVIDSLVATYNNLNTTSSILKVLRAITPTTSSCEYEAEVLTTDITDGTTRNSLTKQIISMQVNPEVTTISGNTLARYVKITPSFTPGTVLEFSKILVRNVTRDATGTRPNVYVSHNAINARYNMFYQLEEIAMSQTNPEGYLKFLTDETGGPTPAEYPKIFRAASNDSSTFFLLDLNPPNSSGSATAGKNYDIYDIQFVGAKDRTRGGIKGVTIELYRDQPAETVTYKAFDGVSYDPVFRYIMPKDDIVQTIVVAPPAKCKFTTTLDGIKVLKAPTFLQKSSPPLSATDTSGGVFGFSSVINSIGSAWNALLPIDPAVLASDTKDNAKLADMTVHKMLDTISATKTLLTTSKNCKDADVLKRIAMLYNIKKGPQITDSFGFEKHSMGRILKSGQSTTNTCDVLFEDLNEWYDDYSVDITDPKYKTKTVKTARFKFNAVNNMPVPDPGSIVYDISANALGLMTDNAALSPVYSPAYTSLDCRNTALVGAVKAAVMHGPVIGGTRKTETQFKQITESFQPTPLSCEYTLQKLEKYTDIKTNVSLISKPITTYVKAIFSLAADGYTATFASAKEYDPNDITFSEDGQTSYLESVPTPLPNIIYYDVRKNKSIISTRVNTQVQNI